MAAWGMDDVHMGFAEAGGKVNIAGAWQGCSTAC
jgi:hypothetical protein